jgi:hypothetical protein
MSSNLPRSRRVGGLLGRRHGEQQHGIQLGDLKPDFTAETPQGTIRFHNRLGGGWGTLFLHLKDFTSVCATELGEGSR